MTDLTAFERQLAGEVSDLMGPVRPVDDVAIFAAITSPQYPRWTTRPLFGATRFAVIGVILALVGGLLLEGVLTRPSDVGQPAAVPSPTSLPSEEIEPGVSRILVDGIASETIAIGPDGSVWRVDASDAKSVAPLQGSAPPAAPMEAWMIEVGPDGVVWVAGPSGVGSWDGQEWTVWSAPVGQRPLAVLPEPAGAALVPWFSEGAGQAEGYANARMGVDRLTRDGTRAPGEPLTLARPFSDIERTNDFGLAFASTSDGDVWAVVPQGARDTAGDEGRIWRWDGLMWHAGSMPGVGGAIPPRDVAVGPDGSLWVYLEGGGYYSGTDTRRLARLQDDEWTIWTKDDGVPRNAYRPNRLMTVGPDGAVWVPTGACVPDPGLAVFDGVTSSSFLSDWCIHDMAVAPDGSIWASGVPIDGGDAGLFRIVPVEDEEVDPGAAPSPDSSPDMGLRRQKKVATSYITDTTVLSLRRRMSTSSGPPSSRRVRMGQGITEGMATG